MDQRAFRLGARANVEAIAEVFNLFNAINPHAFERTIPGVVQTLRLVGGAADPNDMEPSRFAGDLQEPEERVGRSGSASRSGG